MTLLPLLLTLTAAGAGGAYDPALLQYGVCVSCHGAHGEGREALGGPRLSDLDAAYLVSQLHAFRAGERGAHPDDDHGRAMAAVAMGLSDEQITQLVGFIGETHAAPRPPVEGDARGRALYAPCVACHGADAQGVPALSGANLLQQDPAYLTRQLQNYREGRRGGPESGPLAQQMRAFAINLDDDDIGAIVNHIGSLRPALPPLENPPVTREASEGLAAFEHIYAVATHPRCMNCHPDGDAPLQGEDSQPHSMGITRFSPLDGVHCSTCHPATPVGDGQAPLPPADPVWSVPPRSMAFQNRTPAELCHQLQDPAANGGRGLLSLIQHVEVDHLLITSWHSGRPAPPISHEELVEQYTIWAEAGAPCPAPDSATE